MTTRLAGKDTVFLPFNRGTATAARATPTTPTAGTTAYLWEEVWERDTWLDILGRFVHLEVKERVEERQEGHARSDDLPPLPPARRRAQAAGGARKADGAGHNYLIQHSAGSGKTNTHRLARPPARQPARRRDKLVFDTVIVITDRRVLDQQLQDTIYQFEHKQGVVAEDRRRLEPNWPRRWTAGTQDHHHHAPEVLRSSLDKIERPARSGATP